MHSGEKEWIKDGPYMPMKATSEQVVEQVVIKLRGQLFVRGR